MCLGIPDAEIRPLAVAHMNETRKPMPILGKQLLRDGKTGEAL